MNESVSVILPAHDEAGTIADVVARAKRAVPNLAEVLVIDDGSSDGTGRLAAEAGARVVRLSPNRGKGVAVRTAFVEARGDILVLLDADGQDAPEDIPVLLAALERDVTMVVGSRFLGSFEAGAITGLNRMGNRMLTSVVNVLYGARLTDTQAGFRAFRRDLLASLALDATRYEVEVDLLLGALRLPGRVVEVPVRRAARRYGRSGLSSFYDGARILRQIIKLRVSSRR